MVLVIFFSYSMTDPSNRAQFNRQKSLTSGRHHEMVPPHEMHQMGRAMRPMMSKGPPPRNYTMRPPTMKKYRGRSHIKQMMPWANWPSVYNMNQKNTELYIKAYQRGNKIEADYNPSKVSFSFPFHSPCTAPLAAICFVTLFTSFFAFFLSFLQNCSKTPHFKAL